MRLIILITVVSLTASQDSQDPPSIKVVQTDLVIPKNNDGASFEEDVNCIARDQRIVNGLSASDRQFPWASRIAVRVSGSFVLCSASLISTSFVISARHCIV